MKNKWWGGGGGGQQKEEVLWENVGKCCLRGACESPMGLSMCYSPMETVFIKRWVPCER